MPPRPGNIVGSQPGLMTGKCRDQGHSTHPNGGQPLLWGSSCSPRSLHMRNIQIRHFCARASPARARWPPPRAPARPPREGLRWPCAKPPTHRKVTPAAPQCQPSPPKSREALGGAPDILEGRRFPESLPSSPITAVGLQGCKLVPFCLTKCKGDVDTLYNSVR